MSQPSREAIAQVRDAITAAPGGEDLLEALIDDTLAMRREVRVAERTEAADEAGETKPPAHTYREITSGVARRRNRPVAEVEDRAYVPGALRWWRQIHGLTPAEAGERVGYSPRSSVWRQWEAGFVVPPYRTLLLIIAASGMDPRAAVRDPALGLDPAQRLDVFRAEAERRERERRERAERRTASGA
jgi:transcriptional regulator with XRE-family HTH domain